MRVLTEEFFFLYRRCEPSDGLPYPQSEGLRNLVFEFLDTEAKRKPTRSRDDTAALLDSYLNYS